MSAQNRNSCFRILAALVLAFAWNSPIHAEEGDDSLVLVATPQFQDPLYGSTILIAKPLQGGHHLGFILNKPTSFSLAEVFPDHTPSGKVPDPLYLGGPSDLDEVFALVQSESSPGDGSVQIAPNLFLVIAEKMVDQVIETGANHARFFVGAVMWKPGELDEELRRGAWYVLEPEPEVVLRKKTEGLWEELLHRAETSANAI